MFYTNYIYALHTNLQFFFIVIEFQKLKASISKDAPIQREQNLILQEFGCNQIVSD